MRGRRLLPDSRVRGGEEEEQNDDDGEEEGDALEVEDESMSMRMNKIFTPTTSTIANLFDQSRERQTDKQTEYLQAYRHRRMIGEWPPPSLQPDVGRTD